MNTRIFHSLCCIFLVLFITGAAWSNSLHPDLLDKIKRGETAIPYSTRHYDALLARGINSVEGITPPLMPDENFNMLVLLVDFPDEWAYTNETFFDTLIYEPQPGTLVNYFEEVTYGNWTITTVNLPSSTGWFEAPDTVGYYVNNREGLGDYPRNSQKLVEDVVALADAAGVNFRPYDNDGNHYIECLFVVHAGQSSQTTGDSTNFATVKWNTHTDIFVDSVYVDVFAIAPEYNHEPGDGTIGGFAHEAGHAIFGLPDLYDTDYSSRGLGRWSLMASGDYNGNNGDSPAHPDAWCKIKMGVISPTVVTHNLINETIDPVAIIPTVYKLPMNGTISGEYFLVENRQPISYDVALPGDGLLIYHISDTVRTENTLEWYPTHTDNGHYLVALEQADGNWELELDLSSGDTSDPFPGSTNNTTFDSTSTPSSKGYNFENTGVAVNNISSSTTYMTADFIVDSDWPEHVISNFWEVLSLHIADIDSDGDEDILTGGDGWWCDIAWWENDGNENFTEHIISDSADGATDDVFAADVDSDGDMDVLGASRSTRCIRWFENDGSQNFTEHYIAEDLWDANSVCAADIDGDYDIDVLGASDESYEAYIIWWENDGSENFTEHIIAMQDYAFLDVLAYDLEGDGDTDVLGCGYNLSWWENDGNENFTEHIIDEYYWAYSIDLANVDQDGDLDILAALEDEDRIVWWENDGNQNFTEYIISDSLDGANHVYAIDIDDDLDIDVLGAARLADQIILWKNDGYQNFSEQIIAENFNEASSVYAADIDNDGDFDIIGGAENCGVESGVSWWEQVGEPPAFVEDPYSGEEEIPQQFTIDSPYPNPFNPLTVLSYKLQIACKVNLSVYDITGRKVAELVNGWRNAGSHEVVLDAKGFASGLYIYHFEAGDFSASGKMVLIK